MSAAEYVQAWMDGAKVLLVGTLVVAVPALIGLAAFFWAGRLVLHKLAMGGTVATLAPVGRHTGAGIQAEYDRRDPERTGDVEPYDY